MADEVETKGFWARAVQLFARMGFSGDESAVARTHLCKTDFGVLKVALMVAALDGEIFESEYAAFRKLAERCRGFSEAAAAEAFDAALHAAGYLLLQHGRLGEEELLEAFVREATEALPTGFAYGSVVDVRRAFVMWIAMGMSDGDFSGVERRGIAWLKTRFAELKREKFAAELDMWSALAVPEPGLSAAPGVGTTVAKTLKLVPDAFFERAENLLARMLADEYDAAAASDLGDLILQG